MVVVNGCPPHLLLHQIRILLPLRLHLPPLIPLIRKQVKTTKCFHYIS